MCDVDSFTSHLPASDYPLPLSTDHAITTRRAVGRLMVFSVAGMRHYVCRVLDRVSLAVFVEYRVRRKNAASGRWRVVLPDLQC